MKPNLKKKLGLKAEHYFRLARVPENYFKLLDIIPNEQNLSASAQMHPTDFIHIFSSDGNSLIHEIKKLLPSLKKNGMLWISWPKKSSKIPSDIDKWSVMKIGQDFGLVDVKIASYDDNWSSLKFVYRLKDR